MRVDIGDATLYRGDCLEQMDVIESKAANLIACDVPYGTTACKWDSVIPLDRMWSQLNRIVTPGGVVVLTASQPFTSALIMSNPRSFKYTWVWVKNKASGHLNAKKRPLVAHEDIVVFYQGRPTYNPQMTTGHKAGNYALRKTYSPVYGTQKPTEYGGQTMRYPRSVQEVPVVNNDSSGDGRYHPTQKPVALMSYIIKTYSNPGDTVLDFAMGSGTTGVSCMNLGRKFIGIEKDTEELKDYYFNVSCSRILEAYINASTS